MQRLRSSEDTLRAPLEKQKTRTSRVFWVRDYGRFSEASPPWELHGAAERVSLPVPVSPAVAAALEEQVEPEGQASPAEVPVELPVEDALVAVRAWPAVVPVSPEAAPGDFVAERVCFAVAPVVPVAVLVGFAVGRDASAAGLDDFQAAPVLPPVDWDESPVDWDESLADWAVSAVDRVVLAGLPAGRAWSGVVQADFPVGLVWLRAVLV
jgi:hypothetical protein